MKLNWGTGIAIVYSLFALSMVAFAIKASRQKYDLVNEHYYDEAVNYQGTINARNNAAAAHSSIQLNYLPEKMGMQVSVEGNTKSISGVLTFYKPDKAAEDFSQHFFTDSNGNQFILLRKMDHGNWLVRINWTVNSLPCYTEKKIFIQ